MNGFYCNGKKDFCEMDHRCDCDGCEYFNGEGGEERERDVKPKVMKWLKRLFARKTMKGGE